MIQTNTLLIIIALSLGAAALAYIACRSYTREAVPPAASPAASADSRAERRRANALTFFDKLSDIMPLDIASAEETRSMLAMAGMSNITPGAWRGMQILIALAFFALGAGVALSVTGTGGLLLAVCCVAFGLACPGIIVRNETKQRSARIEAQTANVLEELSIAVKSGFTLERAIKLVGDEMEGELADEFARCDRELNLTAASFPEVMRGMAQRCGTAGVASFTSALIQAKEQGSSVSRVLDSQAKLARSERNAQLEEAINKLPAKLVAPIFGIMMLIIVLVLVPPIYDTAMLFTGSYSSAGGTDAFVSAAGSVTDASR